jgi:hypothetical protein
MVGTRAASVAVAGLSLATFAACSKAGFEEKAPPLVECTVKSLAVRNRR